MKYCIEQIKNVKRSHIDNGGQSVVKVGLHQLHQVMSRLQKEETDYTLVDVLAKELTKLGVDVVTREKITSYHKEAKYFSKHKVEVWVAYSWIDSKKKWHAVHTEPGMRNTY